MATSQTDVKSQVIGLSTEAFNAFCEDISGMFGAGMKCAPQESCDETIKGLEKRFKQLASVNSIKAEGILDGQFQLVLGKEGLFTLAGIIVMLPEQRILNNRKQGVAKDAEDMGDAVGEAGNLLVGSWDRVFREGLEGHGHFVQTGTFIGNPWDKSEEKIGLTEDEELLFVPFTMTIEPYPAFDCGVIFPKTIFGKTSEPETEETTDSAEENLEPQTPAQQAENTAEQETADTKATAASESSVESESAELTEDAEPVTGSVSESIQKMAQSPADLPGELSLASLEMCANEIMQKDVLWGDADDSVEQALTKMQQAGAGYMFVGKDGQPDGIVSTFDVAAAISVYLKPMFAKWRRPIDDATLQIKIKWIMTRPIRTIKPDTPLMAIMENMCRSSLRCLPVVDEQGKVVGLVTVFDIFNALQNTNTGLSTADKAPQGPALA